MDWEGVFNGKQNILSDARHAQLRPGDPLVPSDFSSDRHDVDVSAEAEGTGREAAISPRAFRTMSPREIAEAGPTQLHPLLWRSQVQE